MCLGLGFGGVGLFLGVKERLDRLFCGVVPTTPDGEDVRDLISVMRAGNNCGRAGVGLDHGTSSTGWLPSDSWDSNTGGVYIPF